MPKNSRPKRVETRPDTPRKPSGANGEPPNAKPKPLLPDRLTMLKAKIRVLLDSQKFVV